MQELGRAELENWVEIASGEMLGRSGSMGMKI